MGNIVISLLVIALVMCHGLSMAYHDDNWGRQREDPYQEQEEQDQDQDQEAMMGDKEHSFLLQSSKQIVKTRAGEMRVVKSAGGRIIDKPMHIGFITMEPKSLFVPQYMDSTLILFIRSGEAKVGLIQKDQLGERKLKEGDIYRIPAGSTFYLVNTGEGQRLHIICSVDTSESLGMGALQSFYIGGGSNPQSILAGFDQEILESALNVTTAELSDFLHRQQDGPIVYVTDSPHPPSLWSRFIELKEHDRLQNMKRIVGYMEEPDHQEEEQTVAWSWRKLLNSVLGTNDRRRDDGRRDEPDAYKGRGKTHDAWRKLLNSVLGTNDRRRDDGRRDEPDAYKGRGKTHDAYNLFKRSADFRNDYGWSKALDESDYSPLKDSGIGVYLVNLSAGSMLAPHVNPIATEYGVVLRGSGRIQIVFPNGTLAMNTLVQQGDVFWIPRYFAFCQIASRTGPFEFFGFTTSARKNRPQFLVGASSLLREMEGPELATAFGVDEAQFRSIVHAQRESVILPSPDASPPYKGGDREKELTPEEEASGKQAPGRDDWRQQPGEPAEEEERRYPPYMNGERQRLPEVIKNFGKEMVMGFD